MTAVAMLAGGLAVYVAGMVTGWGLARRLTGYMLGGRS
jgi:hypothetical protein